MFDRLSVLLGLSRQNVKRYLLVFVMLMSVMIYLAVESGLAFYQRYLQSYAIPSEVQEAPSETERILKEASAPKWVSEGALLPLIPCSLLTQSAISSILRTVNRLLASFVTIVRSCRSVSSSASRIGSPTAFRRRRMKWL